MKDNKRIKLDTGDWLFAFVIAVNIIWFIHLCITAYKNDKSCEDNVHVEAVMQSPYGYYIRINTNGEIRVYDVPKRPN